MNLKVLKKARILGGTVYNDRGKLEPDSLRAGVDSGFSWGEQQAFPSAICPRSFGEETVIREGILMGWLIGHIGHFWVESFARLWQPWADILPYATPIWISSPGAMDRDFNQALLASTKTTEEGREFLVLPSREPKRIRVNRLFIPKSKMGLDWRGEIHGVEAGYRKLVDHLQADFSPEEWESSERKLYLSREKFDRHDTGEREVREYFEDRGFFTIHPESLPFREQVRLVSQAQHIAGLEGSQMHISATMKPQGYVTLVDGVRRKSNYTNYDFLNLAARLKTSRRHWDRELGGFVD